MCACTAKRQTAMYKISVIIPIYNVERYLASCIESVIASSVFSQCQVLLIDDGSPDGSGRIADEYAARYPNITAFHYENGGLSQARNRGLDRADGEYIFFLDSDDAIAPDYLEHLLRTAEDTQCDIVAAGHTEVKDGACTPFRRAILAQQGSMSGAEYLHRRMELGDWVNMVWNCLYRRALLTDANIRFQPEVRLYEDILFTNCVQLAAKSVCAVEDYGYLYSIRGGSLVHDGVQLRDIQGSLKVLDYLLAHWKTLPKEQQRIFGRVLYEHISMTLYYIGVVSPKDRKHDYKLIRRPEMLCALRGSRYGAKEWVKYLIFRFCPGLYYPLVRKER